MNSNEKKWIILLIAVVIIAVVLIVGLNISKNNKNQVQSGNMNQEENISEEKYSTELDDGTKINTGDEFNKAKTYNNLEISNIQYTEKDGMTVLLADVKNTGTTKHETEMVKIEILGENGEVITEGKPIIGDVEPGETVKLNVTFSGNLVNVKDFRITAVD